VFNLIIFFNNFACFDSVLSSDNFCLVYMAFMAVFMICGGM
jgi:hypothetical protein